MYYPDDFNDQSTTITNKISKEDFNKYTRSITSSLMKLTHNIEDINSLYNPSKLIEMPLTDIKAMDGTLGRINMACNDIKRLLNTF